MTHSSAGEGTLEETRRNTQAPPPTTDPQGIIR